LEGLFGYNGLTQKDAFDLQGLAGAESVREALTCCTIHDRQGSVS
jgi:hypothetical protein